MANTELGKKIVLFFYSRALGLGIDPRTIYAQQFTLTLDTNASITLRNLCREFAYIFKKVVLYTELTNFFSSSGTGCGLFPLVRRFR